ncbi:MAG: type II secretion system protein GspL [Desulfobulbus sp.]|nr:type II secretion system protein GspL [Desulfobulbus sp.]
MGTRTLGIDIGDSHISGVVLEQQRRATILLNWCCLPLNEGSNPAQAIVQLCEQLAWDGEVCLCGLPLSRLSVRNLTLPFSDVKKITQALPFELEEQLLDPLDSLVYDYCLGRKTGSDSLLVVFATGQEWLGDVLDGIAGSLDPDRILPAMVPLAEQCTRYRPDKEPFLLVHADIHSMSIALVVEGRSVLFRRLSHPEEMIMHPPFVLEGNSVHAELPVAAECVGLLARLIEQSLDLFRMENRIGVHPASVILSGPLADMDNGLVELMASSLGLPVARMELIELAQVVSTEEQKDQWQGAQMDRALAVALSGRNKGGLNFRRHHLAKKMSLLSRRRRLLLPAVAACCLLFLGLGYIGFDTYALRQRDKDLSQEMRTLYQSTFPGATKIQDPYVQMQAKLKSLQGTDTPLPYFVADRWVLPVLADISRRIPSSLSMKVGRITLDREGVAMKGTTDSFNGVELMKTALSGSPHLGGVRIVSATADKGKKDGAIRFELQMQLEGL